ncbi:MAG: hypothetical protein HPY70_14770 [Firmicutes bacterium]|nr:hypothetical protein [Bacillota bacterium]
MTIVQRKLNLDKREDRKISIAIMSSFAILAIQYLILIYLDLIGTPYANTIQLFSKVIVGIFYLIALPTVLKRNKIKFINIYFISIFIFLINYLFFNENWFYLKNIIFPFFFTCLPSLVYSWSINNWNILEDVMKKTGILVFIVCSIIALLVFTNKASIGSYNMALSYYMLLPTVVYINEFIENFTIKSFLPVFISFFIILTLGSRGAIMCLGVFVILKLITKEKKFNYKTILISVIIITLIVIILLSLHSILENLYNFLIQFGVHSRSLYLFLRNDVHLSGRELLYKTIIEEIKDNPLFGIGLAGDRRVINGYTHNIILEIISGFGIIIGSIIVILLGIISLKALFSQNIKEASNFISMWFCLGLVHLMVSGSYLIDFRFWIFLGLAINYIKKTKKIEQTELKHEKSL